MEVDVSKGDFTGEELAEMGEAMLLTHAIRKDDKVHALVKKHLKDIGQSIEEISSRHANTENADMAEEFSDEEKPKPVRSIKDLRKKIAGED